MVRKGLSRKTINRRVVRIRQVFKWAVSQEMLSAEVYQGLGTVAGLKRGRSDAKELAAVRPVTETHVRAVLAHASRTVATMAELQMLTGMRSGELVIMRTGDIDRASEVWAYAPAKHKTEHHGHARIVYLGRRAQELIRPFLKMDPDAYLFSPAEAEAERRAALSANRKTPLSCGNRIGTNRSPGPRKKPGEHYKVVTYARAITTACDKAFSPPPEVTNPAEIVECKKAHRFHPHRLRHTAATRFRREANIETARVLLGQKTLAAAEIYAELDTERAI
jgi:integrase